MNKFISFHLLCIFFLCFSVTTTNSLTLPRLSSFSEWKTTKYQNTKTFNLNEDMNSYFYEQSLDHFNYLSESYKTFKQRYIVNFEYWSGANSSAPIFAYLGGEDDIVNSLGFMTDNATSFKALLVYIEVLNRKLFLLTLIDLNQISFTILIKTFYFLVSTGTTGSQCPLMHTTEALWAISTQHKPLLITQKFCYI